MIAKEKEHQALFALNAVLILARDMAYRQMSVQVIADVLDVAEYLPMLMLETKDRTEQFRAQLVGLAEKLSQFQLAVSRFDGEAVPARP
jgi:hypothetical protein